MRANSPSALFASLTLHAAVAALIVVFSLYVSQIQQRTEPVKIFELVAGPPTAPNERDAPALGNTLTLPKNQPPQVYEPPARQPEPEPEPVVETVKTQPVEEAVPTPPKETPKPKPTVKAKDVPKPKEALSKDAKKIVDQMKNKQHVKYLNEKHKIDRARAKEEAARRAAEAAAKKAGTYKPVDAVGIAEGVRGGSTSNTRGGGGGRALHRDDDGSEMDVYEALLKNRLRAAFDDIKPTGLADTLSAEVTFLVAASGEIGNVRISRSSGNAEFDAAVLQTFKRISWPGRRPDNKSDLWRLTFRMREDD